MAFVWSRLALAAVLAVGGATQAAAAPGSGPCGPCEGPWPCDEAPRLACAGAECPTIIASFGDPDRDPPLVTPTPAALPAAPPAPADVATATPAVRTAVEHDVLAVAPKTSPPRS